MGLTKREVFSIGVLLTRLATRSYTKPTEDWAREAVRIADALISELDKKGADDAD